MYSWLDRADYQRPCRDFPIRVDREAYCDEVMHWTPHTQVLSKPRKGRSARVAETRTIPMSVTAETPSTSTACGPVTLRSRQVVPADTFADYCWLMGLTPQSPVVKAARTSHEPPRKMSDEEAAGLY